MTVSPGSDVTHPIAGRRAERDSTPPRGGLDVVQGAAYVMFAYDVAEALDLDASERHLAASAQRQTLRARRPALEYFEFRPTPLLVTLDTPVGAGVPGLSIPPQLDLVLYDFGAVSATYRVPLAGSLTQLIVRSEALWPGGALERRTREAVDRVLDLLGPAAERRATGGIVEDYVLYHVEQFGPGIEPLELCASYRQVVAQTLRSEADALSDAEAAEAVATHIAFGRKDITIIDWNAALAYGREVDDIRTVIEFANVQLLELRTLDRQLDDALETSYALVSQRGRSWRRALRTHRGDARRVARFQVDSAIVFERVTNAIKVFGEEYLGRTYRLIAGRLRLTDWDETIRRKLETLDSIYGKMIDEAAARRMELLEWIIVLLIALSILLSLPG